MADNLERWAIMAAHDAECVCGGDEHYDCGNYRGLTEAEQDIVALWRADRDDLLKGAAANALNITARAEKAEAELERLHSWGGLLELLDEHWPADIFTMPESAASAIHAGRRRDTGPIILGLIRWVDKLAKKLKVTEAGRVDEKAIANAALAAAAQEQQRAERAEAELERTATVTGMADELGARITDERSDALAAIERVRAIYASQSYIGPRPGPEEYAGPPPRTYQGSHVYPDPEHHSPARIDTAAIPHHCIPGHQDGSTGMCLTCGADAGLAPWLRLSIGDPATDMTIVLPAEAVRALRDELTDWLGRTWEGEEVEPDG